MRGPSALPLVIDVLPHRLTELRELPLPERALGKPRVWNDQACGVHDAIVKENDVEIERTRAPPGAAHTARAGLDFVESREQRGRFQRRFDGEHLVQVGRLSESTERRGLLDGGSTDDAALRNGVDGVSCALQIHVT